MVEITIKTFKVTFVRRKLYEIIYYWLKVYPRYT